MPIPRHQAGLPAADEEPVEEIPPLPPKPKRAMLLDDPNLQLAWDVYDQTLVMSKNDRALADKAFESVRKTKWSDDDEI